MNWISVEDRLPKDDQTVLIHHTNGTIFEAEFLKDTPHSYFYKDIAIRIDKVLHWMPLPNPPEL